MMITLDHEIKFYKKKHFSDLKTQVKLLKSVVKKQAVKIKTLQSKK